MLGLTFFGHIGQVYQTDSPLWQPLAFWLMLFAPAILLRGTGWLNALLLMVVMLIAAWSFMYWMIGLRPRIDSVEVVPEGTRCPRPVRSAFSDTLAAGKLYIPQEKARGLEDQLADPALRGIVRLRVRDNGRYTPMGIRFEPRPQAP
jgi:hypothetical protein